MRDLRILPSAKADLVQIFKYVSRQSCSTVIGRRFVDRLRQRCLELTALPATMGGARPELHRDVRSLAFGNYVIFFRYSTSAVEIVNIIEGHRDIDALFE